jgi:ankyrin repeat protein
LLLLFAFCFSFLLLLIKPLFVHQYKGDTAIMAAMDGRRKNTLEVLLQSGADPDGRSVVYKQFCYLFSCFVVSKMVVVVVCTSVDSTLQSLLYGLLLV